MASRINIVTVRTLSLANVAPALTGPTIGTSVRIRKVIRAGRIQ
jgi:hypothetical protein